MLMEMPVQCSGCGQWIELNDGMPCRECRDPGMCRECWNDHAAWHDAKDNQPDDETGMDPYAMRGISRNDFSSDALLPGRALQGGWG